MNMGQLMRPPMTLPEFDKGSITTLFRGGKSGSIEKSPTGSYIFNARPPPLQSPQTPTLFEQNNERKSVEFLGNRAKIGGSAFTRKEEQQEGE
mmetsp:Transcript_19487/g.18613  ORF Transcript_19487/g.18613 Transcript_19487/m.18613 type:complete len:93 (-) Transcript_19487:91-369(-)